MIHDAQDGTSGRHVWRITGPALGTTMFVIAHTPDAAMRWLRTAAVLDAGTELTATDVGSADRTEVALWRDETRLDPTTTDTDTLGGA
jgi:hypothetical protein